MKLLLIDDDVVSRQALRDILGAPPGWEILEAEDGKAALDMLKENLRPDLCVLDLIMPNISGVELLQLMRADPALKHIKVVVTSATRDRDIIGSLAKLQVSGYLLKPYDAVKTRAALHSLMITPTAVQSVVLSNKVNKKTLLAVDDDPVIRTAIKEFITTVSGWDVKLAVDGQDAFECLYAGLRPDLILTDLTMPNVDGIALVNRIRKDRNFESMKVAIISGDKDREKIQQLAQLSIFAYLLKPFNAAQLSGLLSKVNG
jgi:CheY-like chemotaxis protein